MGRDVTQGEWTEHINALINVQRVTGGQVGSSTIALSATAIDTNGGNPYSVPNLGRRAAQPYSDSSLMDQAAANAIATSLLSYGERVTRLMKLTVTGYTVRRPEPGHATLLRVRADPAANTGRSPCRVRT